MVCEGGRGGAVMIGRVIARMRDLKVPISMSGPDKMWVVEPYRDKGHYGPGHSMCFSLKIVNIFH